MTRSLILFSALVITKIFATFGQELYLTVFDFNISVNVGSFFSEEHLQCHYLQEGKVKDIKDLVINERNQNKKYRWNSIS